MPTPAAEPRRYRQGARAEAAAATGRRIVETFIALMRERWLEDITLDEAARAAGVTVQTVIRRFGGKSGLIDAASGHLEREISARRTAAPGALDEAISALVADYEVTGDVVIRLLAQEERHPELALLLAVGRRCHREWTASLFSPWLEKPPREERERRLAGLIAAMDVYTWKLLRRDLGLPPAETGRVMRQMAAGLIGEAPGAPAGA
ncbi:TetR/AcrR family transcriptional regulator [Marinimicrococcus flavescens]|uniref:TetR/AcrR family transcriptional regulator n=1 Tax=Marinimicrococcus flavescens TaxID=3031815 RepID=A0AAP3XU02_9PROT|nr:TetR/AcrR family transcriptional regulator [Marinimicrococcus flavescens]